MYSLEINNLRHFSSCLANKYAEINYSLLEYSYQAYSLRHHTSYFTYQLIINLKYPKNIIVNKLIYNSLDIQLNNKLTSTNLYF